MKAESRLDLRSHRGSSRVAGRQALGACLAALFGLVLPGFVFAQVITEFPASGGPGGIAAGPDGALWFTEFIGNKIGRITTSGVVTEFPIPTSNASPREIVAGPDGNLWFTEERGNKIGRITTGGVITEFSATGSPSGITAGPDGAIWYTDYQRNKIGRISTSGLSLVFAVPTNDSCPDGIAAGPDGNLWFTESCGNKIGRVTTSGTFAEFAVPAIAIQNSGIAAGPDGNLWFTEGTANKIGRITTSGEVTEFPVASHRGPIHIVTGPDGALWFTESFGPGNQIGRITIGGLITEFPASFPDGWITVGPDGNLWFTEGIGKISRIQVAVSRVIPVAISSPGAFGSFFKTAVQLNNPSTESISGTLTLHSGGGSGSASDPSMAFKVAPRQTVSYPDILPAMGLSGVGTMDLVLPVGNQIPNLIAVVRLYNDGGAAGTSGFTEDLIDPFGERVLSAGATGYLIGPADPSRFRYNIGIRTLSSEASLTVNVHASDGTLVRSVRKRYPPTHFEQVDATSFLGGALGPDQSVEIIVVTGSAIIYGATADNTTNDSSIQFARQSD